MEAVNINDLWGQLIVEELIRNEIDYFCISPGSRSTPLTVAAARHPKAKTKIFYDERGAAFHALGYARAAGVPAVLICTSGTAAANYYPAIIEAAQENIPIIVLSADRPPELRNTGANQTIDQVGLFGVYAKWFFDLPCPEPLIKPEMLLTTIDQAVFQALSQPAGVAHLNCMFREPLAPLGEPANWVENIAKRWQENNKPYTRHSRLETFPAMGELMQLADVIKSTQKGILSVGRLSSLADVEAVKKLAGLLNWPVFADITSGLRLNSFPQHVPYFDAVLSSQTVADNLQPDTVLHIGYRMVSKKWSQYLERCLPENYIAVLPGDQKYDPTHQLSLRLSCDVSGFIDRITPQIQNTKPNDYLRRWQLYSNNAAEVLQRHDKKLGGIDEIAAVRLISTEINPGNGLFLAASMPVRDMDVFGVPENSARVAANRGASGIDGTISSAAGFAQGLKKPVTLILGDLAFIHDLNGVVQIAENEYPLIVVVINNGGGGIFSFLPIAKVEDVFESNFGTPHNYEFNSIADFAGLPYFCPGNMNEFRDTYCQLQSDGQSAIIEVKTEREANARLHRALNAEIVRKLEEL